MLIMENQTFYYDENGTLLANNDTLTDNTDVSILATLYKYYVPLMIICCLISVIYNIRVLSAVHWIRRPLSPTLHISLSLAAADAFTSFLIGVGLFINSFLQKVYNYEAPCYISMWLEIYRISGIIITVVHLLALSFNHWLGIFKPLHITTMVTTKKVVLVTVLLWVLPLAFFHAYFIIAEEKFWANEICPSTTVFDTLHLRIVLSSIIIVSIMLMIFCYAHILYMVRKQQKIWSKLSRSGSKKCKSFSRTSTQQRKTMEGNVKAVYTTLLILGSCMLGWMPGVLTFILICKEECVYGKEDMNKLSAEVRFGLAFLVNFLIILKTLANPIIYASRMIEIEEGIRKMKLALRRVCCKSNQRGDRYSSNFHSVQIGYSGSMNATALCKLNGSLTKKRSFRSNYPNTPV